TFGWSKISVSQIGRRGDSTGKDTGKGRCAMSHHNHFFFLRTLWGALRHADWKEAEARAGIFGLIAEFFRAISGFSAWPFFIPAESQWQPSAIRPILNDHGIPNWGWGKQG